MDRLTKNKQIFRTRQLTLQRHRSMVCKTYELKVDRSHLSPEMLKDLRRLFLEAKWFYNDLVAKRDVFHFDYKTKLVAVRNTNGEFEVRTLQLLSAQMRQKIVDRARDSVRAMVQLKRMGRKVGTLKFKSKFRSIPLNQNGMMHKIRGNKILVQNVTQPMRVRGLDQIPDQVEFANATLEQRAGDYFLHITTYQNPSLRKIPEKAVGIDAGIKHQLTLSNGLQIDENVLLPRKIQRLHHELSKRKRYGKNWSKTRENLQREFEHLASQRDDIRKKIVGKLVSTFDAIAVQDDNIAGWRMMWGRRVTSSAIGGIMSDLKTKPRTPIVLNRFDPTTQQCSNCGSTKKIGLEERIYQCDRCGFRIDRDLNSAINNWKTVPAECRELTPADTKASTELMEYFARIPNVSASLVEETGSRLLATGTNGH